MISLLYRITLRELLLSVILFIHNSPFYQLFTFLIISFPSFSFPSFSFSSHHSIFCKMSALVRHRVSLFGKMPVSLCHSFWILSLFYLSPVWLHCVYSKCSCSNFIWMCMCDYIEGTTAELYLSVQERMLQQLLTAFTSWHGHWMQGLPFYIFSAHILINVFFVKCLFFIFIFSCLLY